MTKLICSKCMTVHETKQTSFCPQCHASNEHFYLYNNSDEYLKKELSRILKERKKLGLNRIVGGLECIIINTEFDNWKQAIEELLNNTGFHFQESFQTQTREVCVLRQNASADVLLQRRKNLKKKIHLFHSIFFPNQNIFQILDLKHLSTK